MATTAEIQSQYPLTYNSHGSMIALGVILIVLTLMAGGMRVLSHRKYNDKIGPCDIFIIPAFILTLGLGITVVAATAEGWLGSHSDPTDNVLFVNINKLEYGFWISYVLAVGSIKLSILFFLRRLFTTRISRSWFDLANWTLIGLSIGWTITFLFSSIFICGDKPDALWTSTFWVENKCLNSYILYTSSSTINFVIDLGILVEPLFMISSLRMSAKKKVQACLIFSMSALAVIAGMMRMIFWIQSTMGSRSREVYHEVGLTYPISDLEPLVSICIFWTFLEVGVGFIIACLLPSAKLLDAVAKSQVVDRIKSVAASATSLLPLRSRESARSRSVRSSGSSVEQVPYYRKGSDW